MLVKKSYLFLAVLLFLVLPVFAYSHGITDGDKQAMLAGGYLQYMILGARHMLTGYDHLLFIFGVIFFLTGFKDVLKYITAFTIGHSITLIFATLWGISANYYLIDAFIALTVCYKGFENLDGFKRYLGRPSPNLLAAIFAFGLVHGFGLSTRLQQLPLGDEGLILRIVSFNIGVEVGQVLALGAMLVIMAAFRRIRSFNRLSLMANRGLIAAGVLLFLLQMHGFGHSINFNLLGFETSALAMDNSSSDELSVSLQNALSAYDKAFEERNIMALWEMFDENIVLMEQGSQNLGREEALGKHLAPDLQALQAMSANFNGVRVEEYNGMAIRTRQFSVKGKLPNRLFMAQGYETQNWARKAGQWKLVHMHWSFPAG